MIDSLIHRAARGEKTPRVPFWFMRQAGRYLPEYRELRAKANGFLSLCYTPEMAAEVTLQPIRRFDMDAAIVFSDILVIPHAMGMNLTFEQGEGPRLPPLQSRKDIEALTLEVRGHLEPIAQTLKIVRAQLAPDKSLIGFCGAPWTVACYMIEGGGSKDYECVRRFAYSERESFSLLIEKLVEASIDYLSMQVEAGADIVQIFDSWAGVLSENEYKTWVVAPTRKIVAGLKWRHPDVPIIGFTRGSGAALETFAQESNVDVVGVDVQTPLAWAQKHIHKTLQGNLDPLLLASDKKAAVAQTKQILQHWRRRPFIFNLGHGMVPSTPLENVQAVCDELRRKIT